MVRSTILGTLLCLLLLCGNVTGQNEATGTLTVDGRSTEITYGYADTYENDVTIILTDGEVPREAIPDRTYELAARGDFKGVIFSVSTETQELLTGGWYDLINVVHFYPITNELGKIGNPTLTTTEFDGERISGSIVMAEPVDISGHEVTYDVSFSLSLKKEPLEVTVTGVSDAPSKAFEEWCKALMAGDVEVLLRFAPPEVAEMMAAADSAEIAESLEFQQMMMPTNIEILTNTPDGDEAATIEVKGTRALEVSKGTARMILDDGVWKVGEMSWSSGEDE